MDLRIGGLSRRSARGKGSRTEKIWFSGQIVLAGGEMWAI